MRRLAVLIFFVLCAPAGAAMAPRIVGGSAAATGAYPAQAEVDLQVGPFSYLCGGTLVAPQWVLTAGHCVSDETVGAIYPAADFTVRLGSTTLGAGTAFTVDAVSRDPAYDNDTLAYDGALLHLSTAAPEHPLSVISKASAAAVGTTARVIGWGTTTENGQVSQSLQQVDVPIVSDATCERSYGNSFVGATMVCAGYPQGGKDACQGDSGGPLMVSSGGAYVLAGIVSTGDGCAEPGKYGVYTDLLNTALRSWLASTTGLSTRTTSTTAALHITRLCARTACTVKVTSASPGAVQARLVVSARLARRLGLSHRTISSGSTRFTSAATLRLRVSASFRRRLARHGYRTVHARLGVTALTDGGQRSSASRSVRVRGRRP